MQKIKFLEKIRLYIPAMVFVPLCATLLLSPFRANIRFAQSLETICPQEYPENSGEWRRQSALPANYLSIWCVLSRGNFLVFRAGKPWSSREIYHFKPNPPQCARWLRLIIHKARSLVRTTDTNARDNLISN